MNSLESLLLIESLTRYIIFFQKLQLEMLSDKHRTLAYKSAIENAKTFIQNKVSYFLYLV